MDYSNDPKLKVVTANIEEFKCDKSVAFGLATSSSIFTDKMFMKVIQCWPVRVTPPDKDTLAFWGCAVFCIVLCLS